MTQIKTKDQLLVKLREKEAIVQKYPELIGPGLIKKFKRILLFREKYARYLFSRSGLVGERVAATVFFEKKLILPLGDSDAANIYFFGTLGYPENKLTRFLIKHLKADDVFYDIGASYGFYTLLAHEIIFEGEIHLFEPFPEVFEYAEINFGGKERIFLNKAAVSHRNGTTELLTRFQNGGSGSGRSTISRHSIMENPNRYRKIPVPCISLDEYIKTHKPPSFIKIDVEGAESFVLKGAERLLQERNPVISCEVWGAEEGGNVAQTAIDILTNMGYQSHFIEESGDIRPISRNWFGDLTHINGFDNFIFKKY